MKKALALVVAIALVVWVISWFRAPAAVATSVSRPWPDGLGPLAAVALPPRHGNAASAKLAALADRLPKSEAAGDFVTREISRGDLTIGEPPALPDISTIRELLLREQITWERHDGIGGGKDMTATRATQMTIARTLVASALKKARANDPSAWDDLLAVWRLSRSLDEHSQMMMQTAAFSMVRMVNAVAWKMPLPTPAWFAELQARDSVRPLLQSFHYQTASYARDGQTFFPTKMLADSVDRDRGIAEELVNETRCDVNARPNELGVDLRSVWRRAFRYRAEREAAANALRVRAGKPIETGSRCSDGAWAFDGATLRFSREIATAPPDRPMPLALRLQP